MTTNTTLGSFLQKSNHALTWALIAVGIVAAILTKLWSIFFIIAGFLLVSSLAGGSSKRLVDTATGQRKVDEFTGFHVAVVASVIGIVFLGLLSFAERMIWVHADSYPTLLISKEYRSYTPNSHRMVKFICSQRGTPGMQIREIGDRYVVHCGEYFPETYVITAPKDQFEVASRATANDPPAMPIVIEKDER